MGLARLSTGLSRMDGSAGRWLMVCIQSGAGPAAKTAIFSNADRPLGSGRAVFARGTDQQRTERSQPSWKARYPSVRRYLQVHRFAGSPGRASITSDACTQAPNRAEFYRGFTQTWPPTAGIYHWVREHVASSMPETRRGCQYPGSGAASGCA